VVADGFLVGFGLSLPSCCLVLAVALLGLCFGLRSWLLCLASLAGLTVGFRCSQKLGFRLGLAGSGVYLNLPARFSFCQVALPARLYGYRLFWVGVLGWAWAFVASGVVCFRSCRFCLQAGLGWAGLALGFAFRVGL